MPSSACRSISCSIKALGLFVGMVPVTILAGDNTIGLFPSLELPAVTPSFNLSLLRSLARSFGVIAFLTFSAWSSSSPLSLAWQANDSDSKAGTSTDSEEFRTEAGNVIAYVTNNLNNPTSVVVQPETGIIFVADSGNGQVVRVLDGKTEPVITDFPKELLGTTPPINIGPLCLAFLNKDNLLVGTGGQPAGEDGIRHFVLTTTTMKADATKNSLTLIGDPIAVEPAEGNFFGLAVTPNSIYATSQGSATKGWVSSAVRSQSDTLANLNRQLAVTEILGVANPTSLTVSPHGYLIVSNVGQMGEQRDSVAAFFEPVSKKMLMKLELGLCDVCAIAYSPRRLMYALDMACGQPNGGLYRIIEDRSVPSGLRTKLIAKLPNPTSMCFDSGGALYVTLRGSVDEKGNTKGSLVKIPAEENL